VSTSSQLKLLSIPQISVVMSVYNGIRYLGETIDSILQQEGINFEFIIINDGSTDKSEEILKEYKKKDDRIRIFYQENQGLTKALLKGCSEARGKYIARQDVGDISLPNRFMLQKVALDNNKDVSFVSCWTEVYGPEWEFLFLAKGTGKATHAISIISKEEKYGTIDGPTHHGSVMFRRASYIKAGGYRKEFYFGQDWDLWYRLAELGKFYMIDKPLYKVRIIPDSISSFNKKNQERIAKFSHAALLRRLQGLSDKNILEHAQKVLPNITNKLSLLGRARGLYFIGECLRKNNDNRSLRYLIQSVQANPLFLKSWIRIIQAKWFCNRKEI
jgi:glycosyltransferase involved in cell wall biosynthesis